MNHFDPLDLPAGDILPPVASSPYISPIDGLITHRNGLRPILDTAHHYNVITYGYDMWYTPAPKQMIIGIRPNEICSNILPLPGCEIRILQYLHAKVYYLFDSDNDLFAVYVGSMNFVRTGMVECMIRASTKQHKQLTRFFNDLWKQARPVV